MTILKLLHVMTACFKKHDVDNPRLNADTC